MIRTIVTHDEVFHTDEIFAVAYLLLCFPEAKVIRTRNIKSEWTNDKTVALVDVHEKGVPNHTAYNCGLNNFDHHMDYPLTNGRSAFGLVVDFYNHKHPSSYIYKLYGQETGEFVFNNFKEHLVNAIDKWDTGEIQTKDVDENIIPIQLAFRWMNQDLINSESQYHSFMVAVNHAQNFIRGALSSAYRVKEAIGIWENRNTITCNNKKDAIVSFSDFCMVWIKENSKLENPYPIAIFPQDEETYVVKSYDSNKWPLKLHEANDLKFFHPHNFIAKYRTFDSALKCAKLSLEDS